MNHVCTNKISVCTNKISKHSKSEHLTFSPKNADLLACHCHFLFSKHTQAPVTTRRSFLVSLSSILSIPYDAGVSKLHSPQSSRPTSSTLLTLYKENQYISQNVLCILPLLSHGSSSHSSILIFHPSSLLQSCPFLPGQNCHLLSIAFYLCDLRQVPRPLFASVSSSDN